MFKNKLNGNLKKNHIGTHVSLDWGVGGCLAWWTKKKKKVIGYKVIVIHNINEKLPITGSMMNLNGIELLWWIFLWWLRVFIYYKCIVWCVKWLEVVE
jgi:hypothetical protein